MDTTSAAQLLSSLGPSCRDASRRARLLAQTVLNGIDFVDFENIGGDYVLHVHFLLPLPSGGSDPAAYGLVADPGPLQVLGGTRITGIKVIGAAISASDENVLEVKADQQGDFSPYLLTIGWSRDPSTAAWRYGFDKIDRLFSVAPINFRPGCPVDFDCAPASDCPPELLPEPALDYLARDYASFRQLLLDLVAQRNPNWVERSPADLGIALLELFAYEGDHISYFQDAVANEAYLDTARQRISAKRHAKLIDYTMHDGRNAWTYVQFTAETKGTLDSGQQLLTRIDQPMRFDRQPGLTPVPRPKAPPETELHFISEQDYRTDPALAQVRVFETTTTVNVDPLNNEIRLHAWGNEECCLARGTVSAHLYAVKPVNSTTSTPTAVRPPLQRGDYLLLEEVLSPSTGAVADADPTHRQVVCIEHVAETNDGLFLAELDPFTLEPKPLTGAGAAAPTLPLLEVIWRPGDALTFPVCLTARRTDGSVLQPISLARGNIALADHGRTVRYLADDPKRPITLEEIDFDPPLEDRPGFRLRLSQGPLTLQIPAGSPPTGIPPVQERPFLDQDVREARPAVVLRTSLGDADMRTWFAVPDLLSSGEFDQHFVADVDNEGRAVLRFGDGEQGRRPVAIDHIEAWYRVGNGREGNIGANALHHIVRPQPLLATWPSILALRNPLPARGGVEPELIEEVRQYAPAAFRARQFRAVTEDDYRNAALTIAGVAGAVASFRWTGSWYTVFVGIDPTDDENVFTDPRGVTRLAPAFQRRVIDELNRYRLAGYDLEVRSARYVPLDLALQICAKPGFFAADVAQVVAKALSASAGSGGRSGFFNTANFSFGQAVYLSRLYATVAAIDGVQSANVTLFRRHGRQAAGELERGVLPIGPWEIARLDNDPSRMENGTLTISVGGGS
jgi:hypothetical protein